MQIKRKTGDFPPPKITIKSSHCKNLPLIKRSILGGRSSIITNLWTGLVSENIEAHVGAATAGDYGRTPTFAKFQGDEGLKFAGSGKGWTKEQAEISAIGEFFERYASGFLQNAPIKIATIKEMNAENLIEANPYFTKKQFSQKRFLFKKISKNTRFSWVKMTNALTRKKEWMPAIFCFFPFWGTEDDRHTLPTSTNGIAAHKNDTLAKMSAILEILERDLLTNAWLSGTSFACSEIPKSKHWDNFFKHFSGQTFCVFPKNDLDIPFCILSLVFPPVNGKSLIVSGSACGFSKKEAFESALLEAFQGKKYLELDQEKTFSESNFCDVRTFTDHCRFYTERNDLFEKIPLYDSKNPLQKFEENEPIKNLTDQEKLKKCIRIFEKKGFPLYFYDLSTVDSRSVRISVWRAFCPHLSSLYGDENFRYLGQPRIWNDAVFPEKLKRNPVGKFNNFPHFLG